MKNRTIIGVICMILAVVITFAVAPIVNRAMSDVSEVVRLSKDIKQGAKITAEDLEQVQVKSDTIPDGVILSVDEIVGKYAASPLYSGDYLTADKLTDEANTAGDVFASLNGSKVAVSITIDTFAAGLSGKLENGDIISIIVVDKDTGESNIPDELKYMKVITTTTAGGIDKDAVVKNDDGSFEIPSTVTLLANTEQAKLIAEYEDSATMTAVLVYRGTASNAQKFLDWQDEYFRHKAEETEPEETEMPEDPVETGGDIIEEANDIINGNVDHYDVNEAVNGDE